MLVKDYAKNLKYFVVGASVSAKCIWIGYMNDNQSVPGESYHFQGRMQGVNVVKFAEAFRDGLDMVYTNLAVTEQGHEVCLIWDDLLTELGKDANNKNVHTFYY